MHPLDAASEEATEETDTFLIFSFFFFGLNSENSRLTIWGGGGARFNPTVNPVSAPITLHANASLFGQNGVTFWSKHIELSHEWIKMFVDMSVIVAVWFDHWTR